MQQKLLKTANYVVLLLTTFGTHKLTNCSPDSRLIVSNSLISFFSVTNMMKICDSAKELETLLFNSETCLLGFGLMQRASQANTRLSSVSQKNLTGNLLNRFAYINTI